MAYLLCVTLLFAQLVEGPFSVYLYIHLTSKNPIAHCSSDHGHDSHHLLKREDSPILDGYRIFHNHVRPHMALDGKTPAEACGIEVQGNDKWMTLIQNASRKKRPNAP